MTSAPMPATTAANEHASAQVTDWLDAEELVDIVAEVDDTLAAPEPDDDPLADEGELCAAHFRAIEDTFIAGKIARRRLENAACQEAQRQDPAYRKRAAEAFAAMEARRTAALAEPDTKHNIKTKILTPSSVDDLMATHVTHLGYPPALGWEDARDPTIRALERFGMLHARQAGKAGLLYWHTNDRHSAHKPRSEEKNGAVDWNSVGCSADHDAAHHQFWIDFLSWRIHNVYGESTFSSGEPLVQPSWLALLPTLGVQTREIPRSWPSWEKYKELAGPETDGSVTLLASAELDPAAVFPPGMDTSACDDAAECFTHYTSFISDLSSAFHAAATPDLSSCGQLGRIQQNERTYEEARLVLGGCSVEPKDAAYLSRVYIARCRVLSAGVTTPPEIMWALERQPASDGEQLDLETAEGSSRIAERLSEFADKWKASGREQIGRSVDPQGLVAMAIAGWKLSLQKALERQPPCPLAAVDSVSPSCTPALSAAQLGAAACRYQQQQADAGRGVQAYPLPARKSTSAISTPAISSILGTAARVH